ncbi:MAG: hypothetical protein VR69_08705 [Peptococcaceae bacterium BRH_c4b]|nr:MAG: hypothetical protein VR69_08705 [Peptococcaceae bacterium BRH_c4b]
MNVFGIGSYQPSSYVKTSTTSTKSTEKNLFNLSVTQKKTDVEYKPDQTSDIWGELAREYDIRNATFDELCEMSLKLYEAGQISGGEHAILTFDYDKALQDIKSNIDLSKFPQPASFYLTPASHEGRRDWIAEYEARLEQDSKINPSSCTFDQKLIQILKRLDR